MTMPQMISHEFFGELNLDGAFDIWQKDIVINGKVADVFLTNDSDQILCVRREMDGELIDITWES